MKKKKRKRIKKKNGIAKALASNVFRQRVRPSKKQLEALDKLTREAQDMGLYD